MISQIAIDIHNWEYLSLYIATGALLIFGACIWALATINLQGDRK
jgi:hypothetical protein